MQSPPLSVSKRSRLNRKQENGHAIGDSVVDTIVIHDSDSESYLGPASKPKRRKVDSSESSPYPDFIPLPASDDEDDENERAEAPLWYYDFGPSKSHNQTAKQGRPETMQLTPPSSVPAVPAHNKLEARPAARSPPQASIEDRVKANLDDWTLNMPHGCKKYYVALKARQRGIYTNRDACKVQTDGVKGWNHPQVYRTCLSLDEAKAFVQKHLPNVLREDDTLREQRQLKEQKRLFENGKKEAEAQQGVPPSDSMPAKIQIQQEAQVDYDDGGIDWANVHEPKMEAADPGPILDEEQQAAVDSAMQGRNVFLTGSGGCGKSVVVRELIKRLRQSQGNVAIVAPTGIAAYNVLGATTYNFMGWTQDTGKEDFEEVKKKLWQKKTADRLKSTKVIIIDEISMVSNFHFERISRALSVIKDYGKSPRPFGGCQVIAVGDFCQLPPVKGLENCGECGKEMKIEKRQKGAQTWTWAWTCPKCPLPITYQDQDKWAFKSEAWVELNFVNVHLQKIHRQNDQNLVEMLQKGRLGKKLRPDELNLLLQHPCEVENGVWLSSRKAEVKERNQEEFNKLTTEALTYYSIDRFDCQHEELQGMFYPSSWGPPSRPRLSLNDHRYDSCLEVKIGMPVILLRNIDVGGGLCNGSQGIVIGYKDDKEVAAPNAPNPDSYKDDPEGYRRAKIRYGQARQFIQVPGLESKRWPVVRFNNGMEHTVQADCAMSEVSGAFDRYSLVMRTQIPLAQGWAMTIHKSQGMTLERLVVNLDSVWERGQAYVALSRATALEGLKIEGANARSKLEKILGPPDEVMEFLRAKFPSMFPLPRNHLRVMSARG